MRGRIPPVGRSAFPRLAALLLALALAPPAARAQAPMTIDAIVPGPRPAAGNVPITIIGQNFLVDGTPPTVHLGKRTLDVLSMSDTEIVAVWPEALDHPSEPLYLRRRHLPPITAPVPPIWDTITITGVSPSSTVSHGGSLLTLHGSNFTGRFPRVSFAGVASVRPTYWDDTTIVVESPIHAQPGVIDVRVRTHGDSTDSVPITYGGIRIDSITPASLQRMGGVITLHGADFSDDMRVRLNELEAKLMNVGLLGATAEVRLPVLPSGSPAQGPPVARMRVDLGGQAAGADLTALYEVPAIDRIEPRAGRAAGGTPITIHGTWFGAVSGVDFGGTVVTPTAVSPSRVVVTSPPGNGGGGGGGAGGSIALRLVTPDVASDPVPYQYLSPPEILSVTPAQLPTSGGVRLTIHGANFGDGAVTSVTVRDSGGIGPVRWMAPESMRFVSPPRGAGFADVRVVVDGVEAVLPDAIEYVPGSVAAPTIDAIEPSTGSFSRGDIVTIHGSNFGPIASDHAIRIGDTDVQASDVGGGTIRFALPPGVPGRSVPVEVHLGDLGSPPSSFTYDPPAVDPTPLPPSGLAGGTRLTIFGRDFVSPSVSVDDGPPIAPMEHSPTHLVVSSPPSLSLDTATLRVHSGEEGTVSNPLFLEYAGPRITGVSSSSQPALGGTPITIYGENFVSAATGFVAVPDRARRRLVFVSGSVGSVSAVLPPGTAGTSEPLALELDGLRSNAVPITIESPVITQVMPSAGRASGNRPITIFGTNFTDETRHSVGGIVIVLDGTTRYGPWEGRTPAGSGPAELMALEGKGASFAPYTFLDPPTITSVSPDVAPLAGGIPITIHGTNFGSEGDGVARHARVAANFVPVQFGEDEMRIVLPPGEAGPVDVAVSVDSVEFVAPGAITYDPTLAVGGVAPRALALAPLANPLRGGRLELAIELPDGAPATLEVHDVAGRRVAHRDVGALGAGRHVVRLGDGHRLPSGLYLVRLRQGAAERSRRVTLLE